MAGSVKTSSTMVLTRAKMYRILLLLVLVLAACGDDGRDPRDAEAMFRALIADPIPTGTENLVSTGYITEDDGHNVYLRFNTTIDFLPELIALNGYEETDCNNDTVRGRLALPQGLEGDIGNWFPLMTGATLRCYISDAGYSNTWTDNGSGALVIRTETLTVYFNETGNDDTATGR
jgi:hypothetical protein